MRSSGPESTATRRLLKAAAGVLVVMGMAPAGARAQRVTVTREDAAVFAEPGGTRLGRLPSGASYPSGTTRGRHTQFTLEGWIFRTSLEPSSRDSFTLSVSRDPEENVRESPNGRVIARLVSGTLLNENERRGQWVRVRRSLWVATADVRSTRTVTAEPATADRGAAAPTERRADAPRDRAKAPVATSGDRSKAPPEQVAADPHRGVTRRRVQLFRAPDSAATGSLESGAEVRIVGRAGPWVRVETQAWVRESEVRPADANIISSVTAAELRGAPEEFRGRLLRWTIQFLALQTADELRSDFTAGQRYILARGPAPEYAFVYVIVPPERVAEVERLAPLSSVTVVARVVNGRSSYLANPILELVELP